MNEPLVNEVRDLVADPTRGPALHALLNGETTRVIEELRDPEFSLAEAYSDEEFVRRLGRFEEVTEDLGRTAGLLAYWSPTPGERILRGLTARLANAVDRSGGQMPYLGLSLYPAVLVLYGAGLGAVIGRREGQLAELLGLPCIRERETWRPAALVLSGPAAIDHRIGQRLPGLERHHTPASDRLFATTAPWLAELEPDAQAFEHAFDRWEYLLGLVAFDLARQGASHGYAPVGRFSWRGRHGNGIEVAIGEEILTAGVSWPLMQAGAFGGNLERLAESTTGWHQYIASARNQQF